MPQSSQPKNAFRAIDRVILCDQGGLRLSLQLIDEQQQGRLAELCVYVDDIPYGPIRLPLVAMPAMAWLVGAAHRIARTSILEPAQLSGGRLIPNCDSTDEFQVSAESLGWTDDVGVDPDTWLDLQLSK